MNESLLPDHPTLFFIHLFQTPSNLKSSSLFQTKPTMKSTLTAKAYNIKQIYTEQTNQTGLERAKTKKKER